MQRHPPRETAVNEAVAPARRAQIEVYHGDAGKALELLQRAAPYELGLIARLVPPYIRGQEYLRQGKGEEAAAEFQRILEHRGSAPLSTMTHALAHLGLARAYAISGDTAKAKAAYQD